MALCLLISKVFQLIDKREYAGKYWRRDAEGMVCIKMAFAEHKEVRDGKKRAHKDLKSTTNEEEEAEEEVRKDLLCT